MIGGGQIVSNVILMHKSLEKSIAKICTIITNYRAGGTKAREDIFLQNFENNLLSFVLQGMALAHLDM